MAQDDFGNLGSPLPGADFIDTYLEPWRNTLHTNHSGNSRPTYIQPGGHWLNTASNPWILNLFDGSEDIPIARFNTTTNIATHVGDGRAATSDGIRLYNSSGTLMATIGASTGTAATWVGQQNYNGDLKVNKKISFTDQGELTIAAGLITVTGTHHTVDTEGDAASDDLTEIAGASDGQILFLRAAHTDRTVVIKHGISNILTMDGNDVTLDDTTKEVMLRYDLELTTWKVLAAPVIIPTVPVDSVFGRTGAVTAALNDYTADLIDNDSIVSGDTVADALDTLDGRVETLENAGAGWTKEELTITSGNSFELTTSLPADVTEIKIFFADCQPDASSGSSSRLILELGDSGGYETSGYESTLYTGTNLSTIQQTDLAVRYLDGFSFLYGFSAGAQDMSGVLNLNLIEGNHWHCDSIIRFHHQNFPNAGMMVQTGEKILSGVLTSLRINTPDGSAQVFEGSTPVITLWYR